MKSYVTQYTFDLRDKRSGGKVRRVGRTTNAARRQLAKQTSDAVAMWAMKQQPLLAVEALQS